MTVFVPFLWPWVWSPSSGPEALLETPLTPMVRTFHPFFSCLCPFIYFFQNKNKDWQVAGGQVKGADSFNTFNTILQQASQMETGFIVLQHDLFETTVDLAIGYTLNAALTHNPKFNVSISDKIAASSIILISILFHHCSWKLSGNARNSPLVTCTSRQTQTRRSLSPRPAALVDPLLPLVLFLDKPASLRWPSLREYRSASWGSCCEHSQTYWWYFSVGCDGLVIGSITQVCDLEGWI